MAKLPTDERAQLRITLPREEQRCRSQSELEIRAGRFAELVGRHRVVEHVVDKLEGKAEVAAVGVRGLDDLRRAASQQRRRAAALADEAGRLEIRLLQVVREGVLAPGWVQHVRRRVAQLHEFAFDQVGYDGGEQLRYFGVAQPSQRYGCSAEQKVARQYGHFVRELNVGGWSAAARLGVINNIVVKK